MRQGVSALKKYLCLLVGVAVLAVAAVPAVGQSSDKVTPDAVTRKTKPAKASHIYPWKVTTFGAVKKPRTNCRQRQRRQEQPVLLGSADRSPRPARGKVRVTYTLANKVIATQDDEAQVRLLLPGQVDDQEEVARRQAPAGSRPASWATR